MIFYSIFEGIIFVEGTCDYYQQKGYIEYKKDSFYNQQMKSLDNVKHQLAQKAKNLGANAIINFQYGQKNTTFLRSILLSLDDNIKWYGTGLAVVISEDSKKEIMQIINNY